MTSRTLVVLTTLAAIAAGSPAAIAQTATLTFDNAAYVSCREAHIMPPDQRIALSVFLANHAAKRRGVTIPDGAQGAQLASLVRGGCTLSPDAYLFTVIDRAIVAESSRLPKR